MRDCGALVLPVGVGDEQADLRYPIPVEENAMFGGRLRRRPKGGREYGQQNETSSHADTSRREDRRDYIIGAYEAAPASCEVCAAASAHCRLPGVFQRTAEAPDKALPVYTPSSASIPAPVYGREPRGRFGSFHRWSISTKTLPTLRESSAAAVRNRAPSPLEAPRPRQPPETISGQNVHGSCSSFSVARRRRFPPL